MQDAGVFERTGQKSTVDWMGVIDVAGLLLAPPVVSNNVNMEQGGNSNDPHHIPSGKSERKLNILGSEFIQLDKYNSGSNVVLLKLWKYIIVKQHEYT